MKAVIALFGILALVFIPAKAQSPEIYASSDEFFSSSSYLGFEILMNGIGCLRRMGLGSGEMPTESENGLYMKQQLDRCIASLDGVMYRLDQLFPKETADILSRNYFDGGLKPATFRYAACLTGDSQACRDRDGSIAETIELMETSVLSIEEVLDDWYVQAYSALPDRIFSDFRDEARAAGAGVLVSSFASEEEFFASQPYLAYVILNNGLECLDREGLFSGEIKRGLRGDPTWVYAGLTSCMGRIYAVIGHVGDIFSMDTANALFEDGMALSSAVREYASCVVWEPREAQVCGASGPPVDSTGPATAAAIHLQAELTRWYYETWCPIPNRATISALCVEVVGHE